MACDSEDCTYAKARTNSEKQLKAAESIAGDISKLTITSSHIRKGDGDTEVENDSYGADMEQRLRHLILLIHVAANYSQRCDNKPLPDAVEYFGSALLGRASVSSFPDRSRSWSHRFAPDFS